MSLEGKKKLIKGSKGGQTQRAPIEAPDSLVSIASARVLDLISEGEIEGFAHANGALGFLRDIYLDETPIANADGSLNFKNVDIDTRLGTQSQDYMKGFPSVESEVAVGVELTAASGYVRAINNLQLDAIRVMIGVNSLSSTNASTGDISGYRVDYAIDIKADAGAYVEVIKGAFNGKSTTKYQRSHRINLPAAVTNWTLRVRRLTADTAALTIQDTTVIDSITEIVDARFRYPMSALVGVIVDASQFRSVPQRGYYIKGRKIRIPSNYNPITRVYTGVWNGTFQNAWSNNPAWIFFDMVTNSRYGLGNIVTDAQVDKWSLYAIGQYCDGFVPTGTIKRATATTGSVTLSASSTDNSYNRTTGSFLTDGFLAGDEINATGFSTAGNNGRGVIKTVTALKVILEPDHALVTNAAVAARTLVTQDPTEPRFTASIFFQRQEEAYKVIQDMTSIFRGISYWGSGSIVPVCDMPSDPVYTYANSNVVNGKFTYQGSGRRARHTVALVSWSDPADFGRTKVEYVADETGITRYGIQQTQVNAIGCTSQGTARRIGKWLLFSERLETDVVTFEVGLEGTLAAPGQIIRIADRARAGKRIGGRIVTASLTSITVDSLATPAPIVGDTIIVATPAGKTVDRAILTINTTTKVITFATLAAGETPVVGSTWATESSALYTQLFRVISVSEGNGKDLTFAISALQHVPSKFSAVELGTKIETRPITALASTVQLTPTGLSLVATPRVGQVLASTVLTASWLAAPGAIAYEIQWRPKNGEWTTPGRVSGLTSDLNNAFAGEYQFKIVAIGALNIRSPPAISSTLVVNDQTTTPGFVADLNASISNALTTAQNAQATADGAVESFWQDSPPVIGSGAGQAKVGDIWFDTNDGNRIWRVVGVAWVDAQDDQLALAIAAASTAQATADGKVKTFFQASAPVATGVGDLWVETDNGNHLWWWSGTIWDDSALYSPIRYVTSVSGVLTLNCKFDEQFVLTLNENITSVLFTNANIETTLIIEVRQTGNFTIAWPASVLPAANTPYVVTTGGTALNPKIDTVGLHTDNRGVLWYLRVDKQDTPAAGGSTGSLSAVVTPNPAYGYAISAPSVAVSVAVSGQTGAVTYAWTRAAGGAGDWGGSSGDTGGGNFTCSNAAIANPTFSRTGSTNGYVAQNWRVVATDSSVPPKTVQVILEIALEDNYGGTGGSGGWTCVSCSSFVMDGRRARDVTVGSRLMGIDPVTLQPKHLKVSYSETKMAECVRLEFSDGTTLSCSTTAPIPTPDGLEVAAHMTGKAGIVDAGRPEWLECISVTRIGEQEVQHITCENGVFFAGDVQGQYVGHHNLKNNPDEGLY